jgi:hypothetical protein
MYGRCVWRDCSSKLKILPVSLDALFFCRLAESTNLGVALSARCQLEVPPNHYRAGFGFSTKRDNLNLYEWMVKGGPRLNTKKKAHLRRCFHQMGYLKGG